MVIFRMVLYIFVVVSITSCNLKESSLFGKTVGLSSRVNDGKKNENISKTTEINIDSVNFEYKIRPHDRLSIITYKRPELSTNTGVGGGANGSLGNGLLVNSKGIIRLPLVKDVKVVGLTQREVQVKLEKKFSEYLKHPSVQVEVLNKKAFVLGEVNRPGPIELKNEEMSLLQLISTAGDFTRGADKKSIMILKNHGDKINTKVVDLTDANSVLTANQMIGPNDVVYVMPKDSTLFNDRVGEISPVFNLITSVLTPFLTVQALTR